MKVIIVQSHQQSKRLEAADRNRMTQLYTWLRAIEVDLKPLNIGLLSAWKKATNRETWQSAVGAWQRSRRVCHEKKKMGLVA